MKQPYFDSDSRICPIWWLDYGYKKLCLILDKNSKKRWVSESIWTESIRLEDIRDSLFFIWPQKCKNHLRIIKNTMITGGSALDYVTSLSFN